MQAMIATAAKNVFVTMTLGGAISGGLGAIRADFQTFKALTTPVQAMTYDYKVVAWRFLHGAIVGGATGFSAAMAANGLSSWLGA